MENLGLTVTTRRKTFSELRDYINLLIKKAAIHTQ